MHPFHLNWFTRYSLAVDLFRELVRGEGQILEVGSGSFGLAAFVDRQVIGLDAAFEPDRHKLLSPVRGHAGILPFKDRAFEAVISLDLIEHIPGAERPRIIAEMFRVCARCLIIACPIGVTAATCDRQFADWLAGRGLGVPWWLEEHLQTDIPERQEILSAIALLPEASVKVIPNENSAIHTMAVIADHTPEILDALRPSLNSNRDEWLNLCRGVNFGECYREFFVVSRSG